MQVTGRSAVLAQSAASIFNAVFWRPWMDRSLGLFNWQNTANFFHITATFTLYCNIIYIWLLLGYLHFFFFFFFKFPDTDVVMDEQDHKRIQTWRFSFIFFISCISCMLMFCACFCKDWMRYCTILATIALDSCTSQLSINMLKE